IQVALRDAGGRPREDILKTKLLRDRADPVEWLENELQVSFLEGTDSARIALTGPDPDELPLVVNAGKDAYITEIAKIEQKQRIKLRNEFEKAINLKETSIYKQRKSLEALAERMNTTPSGILTLKQKFALEEYAALKKESAAIRSRLREIQMRLMVQKAQ